MKNVIQHAFVLLVMGFLIAAPLSAAANPTYTLAQDGVDINSLLEGLFTNGAEIIFANIDDQGVPGVIYGQLGIPSEALALTDEMYDGCIAMALVSTQGEFLNLVFELIGEGMLDGGGDGGGFALAQDGGSPFDQIIGMLGTEFNLLINVFVNVDEATSLGRMNNILSHMTSEFGFSFVNILNLRIDESLFPPEAEIELPFDSIDVYINQETHEFDIAVDTMLDVMSPDGFLPAIDRTKFTQAFASASALIAIPDMAEVVELINSFGGGGEPVPPLFHLAQVPFEGFEGPIALAAAGYLGEQYLSASDTSLHVEDLLGVTGTLEPLPTGNSLVVAKLPYTLNITSFSPNVEGQSFYENESNMVIWNSTALGVQSDYIINFDEGEFPPQISIDREFSPDSTTPGGSTTVTVTVTNEGTDPIANLSVVDDQLAAVYSTVAVTGTTSQNFASLAAGATATITYTVTFANEGGYGFAPVEISYEFDGDTYSKRSTRQGYTVEPDIGGLLWGGIMDGMPYTGVALGVVALVGIYAIWGLTKSRAGRYQV
ncbi:MAG: CARDB domain-containing protein [Candidatus Thorarchaeota archaeon]